MEEGVVHESPTDAKGFGVRGVLGKAAEFEPRIEHLVRRPLHLAVDARAWKASGKESGSAVRESRTREQRRRTDSMKEKFANEVTKYENVTVEEWAELKTLLHQAFRFPIQQNQSKVQWGSTAYEWDTGVFEWDFHQNDNPNPDKIPNTYYLEIRIKRRPADPRVLAIEAKIAEFFGKGKK